MEEKHFCKACRSEIPSTDKKCKKCGCDKKVVEIKLSDKIELHTDLSGKVKELGIKKPTQEFKSGDSLHRKTGRWNQRDLHIDRRNPDDPKSYREIITDKETGEIIHKCEESLSQHTGHGDAKNTKAKDLKINSEFRKKKLDYLAIFNIFSNVALVVVSFFLLCATLDSINATQKLIVSTEDQIAVTREQNLLNERLFLQEERLKTALQISLAKDLLKETEDNRDILLEIISNLSYVKNRSEVARYSLETTYLEQSKKEINFGSETMRKKYSDYLEVISAINDDLEEIKTAQTYGDKRMKNESVEDAISRSILLFDTSEARNTIFGGVNIDEFIEDIETYIHDRQNYDDSIREQIVDVIN